MMPSIDGSNFVLDGKKWVYVGTSAFRELEKYLRGVDPFPVFTQWQELSQEFGLPIVLRIFWHYDGALGQLIDPPNEVIVDMTDTLNEMRLLVEWTAGDVKDEVWFKNKFYSICEALQGKDAFIELGNECTGNGIYLQSYTQPQGVISSHGSNYGDPTQQDHIWLHQIPWSYVTFHLRRDYPKMLLDAQPIELHEGGWSGFNGFNCPIVFNEDIGFGEVEVLGRRSTSTDLAFKLGVLHSLWEGGGIHTQAGVSGDLLGDIQRQCVEAYLRGASSIINGIQ